MASEQGSEKVACDMAEGNPHRAGSRLRRSIALRADLTQWPTA
jgi:hypothetical protein